MNFYYKIKNKYKLYIPIYGSILWDKIGINKLLFSDDFHIFMKFYHKILIPIIHISFCIWFGRFLAIISYK